MSDFVGAPIIHCSLPAPINKGVQCSRGHAIPENTVFGSKRLKILYKCVF